MFICLLNSTASETIDVTVTSTPGDLTTEVSTEDSTSEMLQFEHTTTDENGEHLCDK